MILSPQAMEGTSLLYNNTYENLIGESSKKIFPRNERQTSLFINWTNWRVKPAWQHR